MIRILLRVVLNAANGVLPNETTYRLLRRYRIYQPESIICYAMWCEKYHRHGPAAQAYQQILNQYLTQQNSSTLTSREEVDITNDIMNDDEYNDTTASNNQDDNNNDELDILLLDE